MPEEADVGTGASTAPSVISEERAAGQGPAGRWLWLLPSVIGSGGEGRVMSMWIGVALVLPHFVPLAWPYVSLQRASPRMFIRNGLGTRRLTRLVP